jgi:hypothetical protein
MKLIDWKLYPIKRQIIPLLVSNEIGWYQSGTAQLAEQCHVKLKRRVVASRAFPRIPFPSQTTSVPTDRLTMANVTFPATLTNPDWLDKGDNAWFVCSLQVQKL